MNDSGDNVDVIFINFAKAFDKVSRSCSSGVHTGKAR